MLLVSYVLLCVCSVSATPVNVRRGQFELFWYSHHCFVLFFGFLLFHGKGGINPNYWKYAGHNARTYALSLRAQCLGHPNGQT